ncbi:MAG: Maebl [Firmicutes bacterium]|nr:Maebl [Bacillota bacterium]
MNDMEQQLSEERFAVLVDGDNAQASLIVEVLKEVAKYGKITIRRVYGDWTTREMESWKKYLPQNALQPVQQFRNTTGKNATDSAMIIDAMDILYGGNVDGFAIVSSDSDYTRLAIRLRENGKMVIGLGRKQTPEPFLRACDLFVYTENLVKQPVARGSVKTKEKPVAERKPDNSKAAKELEADQENELFLIAQAYEMVAQEDGWARLSDLGKALHKVDPAFDLRTYGQSQLSKMIEAHSDLYELEREKKKGPSQIYIRRREVK